jgi:nicotinamide-nucleotide amidase
MSGESLRRGAGRVLDLCRARSLRVATAESCTGGLVAAVLTEEENAWRAAANA